MQGRLVGVAQQQPQVTGQLHRQAEPQDTVVGRVLVSQVVGGSCLPTSLASVSLGWCSSRSSSSCTDTRASATSTDRSGTDRSVAPGTPTTTRQRTPHASD